jgi:shikimate dehydrogenase
MRPVPAGLQVTAERRVVAVIGDPIAHSRSPAMHNAAFRALDLPYVYVAFRVAPARVAEAIAAVRALDLAGLNVTIPHKEAVVPFLDRLSRTARICTAVNTIVPRGTRLVGENTDVGGLERDLSDHGVGARVESAVVLGAGGSARAAVVALARRSGRIVVAARRPERAQALVDELAPSLRARLEAISLASLRPRQKTAGEILETASVVVNATSAGMSGSRFPPLEVGATPRDSLFYDLVYTAERTPFVALARGARRRAANGLGMLLHQGALAFELWTGEKAPLDVMRRAIR